MILPLNCFQFFLICLFFIWPTFIFSQDENLSLKRGRLYTTEGFEVKFLKLNQQGLKYIIEDRKGKMTTYDQNDILRIDRRSGTEALNWGAYIGSIALLESWLIVKLRENSTNFSSVDQKDHNRKVIIGTTIGATLIGLLIGSSKSKYKRVFDDPDLGFAPRKLGFNFSSPNNVSSLTLSYNF